MLGCLMRTSLVSHIWQTLLRATTLQSVPNATSLLLALWFVNLSPYFYENTGVVALGAIGREVVETLQSF